MKMTIGIGLFTDCGFSLRKLFDLQNTILSLVLSCHGWLRKKKKNFTDNLFIESRSRQLDFLLAYEAKHGKSDYFVV